MNNLVAYEGESDDESPTRRRSFEAPMGYRVQPAAAEQKEEEAPEGRQRKDSDMMFDDSEMFDPSGPSGRALGGSPSGGSESGSEGGDWAEPPPPARPHTDSPLVRSPSQMRGLRGGDQNPSVVSLVSYGGGDDDESPSEKRDRRSRENAFDREDAELAARAGERGRDGEGEESRDGYEPAPPARPSQDDDDEAAIDAMLEEGQRVANMRNDGCSSGGSSTPCPAYVPRSPTLDEYEEQTVEDEVALPPSPGPCDPALEARFRHFFAQKERGHEINKAIQRQKQFHNPSFYDTAIENFNIDEKGTNFPSGIFDTSMFSEDCFYDAINADQTRMHVAQDARKAAAAALAGQR